MSSATTVGYTPSTSQYEPVWLHRYTCVVVALTFVLIIAGGNVTSKAAGLAVPDWPLSFGSVNPSGWVHQPLVRDEHGHRLIGATVGLLVIGLVLWLAVAEPRQWVRRMGYAALLAVIVQGVMGGLRVTEKSLALAIVHGCFAQAFFCLTIAIALATSPRFPGGVPFGGATGMDGARNRALRTSTAAMVAFLFMQLVLGALLRHLGGLSAALIHIFGALAVGGCLIFVAQHVFSRPESEKPLATITIAALLLYGFQILLGVLAFVLVMPLSQRRPMTGLQAYVPTIHVALGAIILGLGFAIAFRAYALTGSKPQTALHTEEVTA